MKRSEYVQMVNDVANAETKRLVDEVKDALSEPGQDKLAKVIGTALAEMPSMSARIAATIIEKTGVIAFDPEDPEAPS